MFDLRYLCGKQKEKIKEFKLGFSNFRIHMFK